MKPAIDNVKKTNNKKKTCRSRNAFLSYAAGFIGRTQELKGLLEHISPQYRQHITVVDGINGIGKTSLVLQAAGLCQNESKKPEFLKHITIPVFEAIVFVSLKQTFLKSNNHTKQIYKNYGLQYIFKTIASTLKQNTDKIHKSLHEKQIEAVYQCLNQQNTLLIIDNLELLKGTDKDSILLFLSNLPKKVQAIITTREKVDFYSSISLYGLSKDAGIELIKREIKKKEITLTESELIEIYNLTNGVPLAIVYAVGIKKNKKVIQLSNSDSLSKDKTYLLFKQLLELLNNQLEYQILHYLSFFSDSSSIEAIAYIANVPVNSAEIKDAIIKLENLSLIECKKERYSMHTVTCEYLAEQFVQNIYFEKGSRNRWVQWYLDLTKKYGGKDWENWKHKYKQLKIEWNNLLTVLEWCATKGYYERVRNLWTNVNQFANLENYWHDRLFWLTWLIEESQKREDWNTASYCMSEKGFTLIQMGDISQAESLLSKALNLEKVFGLSIKNNLENQTLICQHFALLHIAQGNYGEAYSCLKDEKSYIESMKSFDVKPRDVLRRKIAVDTLEAEIYFKKEDYEEAQSIYKEVVKKSAQIKWHRRKQEAQTRIFVIQSKILHSNYKSGKINKFKDINRESKFTEKLDYSINPHS